MTPEPPPISYSEYAKAITRLLQLVRTRPDTIPRAAEMAFRRAETELETELKRLGQAVPADLRGQ